MKKYIIFALVSLLYVCCYAQINNGQTFVDLKGKNIILPTYGDGQQELPFVYSNETFYTGNTSKKNKIEGLKCLGVPVKIVDTTILNKNKLTAKYLILFAIEDKEYTLCIPLVYSKEKKSKELKIIRSLFYPYPPNLQHLYIPFNEGDYYCLQENIFKVSCYDARIIGNIEKMVISKEKIVSKKAYINNKYIEKIFFSGTPNSQEIDGLYVILSDGIQNNKFRIEPILEMNDDWIFDNSI